MKRIIDPFAHAPQILNALKTGALLTTKNGDKINTMTIGWGHLGIEWNTPTFIAYVRGCRHTKPMLDAGKEFTVNIPLGTTDRNILKICGTKSGRDMNKISHLGLTLEEPQTIGVPGIRELPLTLECRVIYSQQQVPECVLDGHILTHYSVDKEVSQDYHTAYYGQILSAYIIE